MEKQVKRLIAINGSPRKAWNTAQLLGQVVEGARNAGAEAQLVHLVDLEFKGCQSCFACKRKAVTLEYCAICDGLQPLLAQVVQADALVLGSPFYFGEVTASMRALMERLCYPALSYDGDADRLVKRMQTAFIYTMGIPRPVFDSEQRRYQAKIDDNAELLQHFFGHSQAMVVCDTLQFSDYGLYAAGMFDPEQKIAQHKAGFKTSLLAAFDLGAKLVGAKLVGAKQVDGLEDAKQVDG